MHRWMVANAEEFAKLLKEVGRPEWGVLAEALGDEGLLDGEGKRPTKEGARQTWWKVKKDLASRKSSAPITPTKPYSAHPPVRMLPVSCVQPQTPAEGVTAPSDPESELEKIRKSMRDAANYRGKDN